MNKLKSFYYSYKKEIIIYGSIALFLVCALISFVFINNNYSTKQEEIKIEKIEKEEEIKEEETEAIEEVSIEEEKIRVDVKGYVVNPGVYELNKGQRVIDAINMAGGLSKNAYTRYINLSKKLYDEYVIIVNSKEEIDEYKKSEEKENIICENISNACTKPEEIITSEIIEETFEKVPYESNTSNKNDISNKTDIDEVKENDNKLVNINTATMNELMELDGIGESKAKSIIEYREANGPFESISDIKKVSGIGESVYAKIKENITT